MKCVVKEFMEITTKITEVLVLIVIAGFTSSIFELNILAKNIENKHRKNNIVYISEALTNAVCGILLSLTFMLITDNLIAWIISDIIGSFIGTSSFKFSSKILLSAIEFFRNVNIDDIVNDLDKEKEDSSKEDKDSTDN